MPVLKVVQMNALFSYAMSQIYCICRNIYICLKLISNNLFFKNLFFLGRGKPPPQTLPPKLLWHYWMFTRSLVVVKRKRCGYHVRITCNYATWCGAACASRRLCRKYTRREWAFIQFWVTMPLHYIYIFYTVSPATASSNCAVSAKSRGTSTAKSWSSWFAHCHQ